MGFLSPLRIRLGLKKPKPIPSFGSDLIDALLSIRINGTSSYAPPTDIAGFFRFASRRVTRSHSQLFQDLWALWSSNNARDGYFVEIGAHDGVDLSNTLLLENIGWRGIVAEPNPELATPLRANRRCYICTDAVHSESGLTVDFEITRDSTLSRISDFNPNDHHEHLRQADHKTVAVKTISLADLLDQAGAPSFIEFLSIDTEGSEYEILSALDFSRWRFGSICVEHNYTPARERIHDLLSRHGYERIQPELTLFDDWYIYREDKPCA